MKAASLVVKLANGSVVSEAGEQVAPLIERGRQVRDSGLFDGKPALAGMVLSSNRPGPVMRFRVAAAAEPAEGSPKKKR